jgi:hypothetical protein
MTSKLSCVGCNNEASSGICEHCYDRWQGLYGKLGTAEHDRDEWRRKYEECLDGFRTIKLTLEHGDEEIYDSDEAETIRSTCNYHLPEGRH